MKRYNVYADTANGSGIGYNEDPQGEWARAEDVAAYFELLRETLDEIDSDTELVDSLLRDGLISMMRD